MLEKREATIGAATIRMRPIKGAIKGVVIIDGMIRAEEAGDSADEVWRRLLEVATKFNPSFIGFDGAKNRFFEHFPQGFQSADYGRRERDYKIKAKAKLDATVPLDAVQTTGGFGEAVWSVFQTNMLFPFEKMRVRDALRSPDADDFVKAAARFALGEGKPALLAMERALKPHDCAKWTVVTYLPFLWRPEAHMFLKPEVTTEFAANVGHRFADDYEPRLDIGVYESLLDLAGRTAAEIADLKPQDRIDVQSFIWTVGRYKEKANDATAA